MLTLEINDARLEQKILEKARTIGKSVQDMLKDFVVEKIQEDEKQDKLPFEFTKLDYRKHIKIIDYGIDDEELSKEKVPLFSDIGDAAEYVHNLRQQER